jgi:AraC-like DNA-binding protein
MATFYLSPPPSSTYDKMDHDARIEAALADLESQERPNVSATARKHNVARRTLAHRFKGETGLNREATSYSRKQLTDS